ncbi:MAG: hypothetical protein IIB39_08360 [Candidatus Marinimicrobia bacterium]|nr:hypothetical protein [Candidatus Neomarinimicrobiota bacterium]
MKHIFIFIILFAITSSEIYAQERLNCNDYYLTAGRDYQANDDYIAALSFYFKQRKYYPGCPETETALYNSIQIFHEKIMASKGVEHTAEARSLVIEFSEISDDSTMIADVKSWWFDIQTKEKEITLTATVFWTIVGSIALVVLYFTAAGS